MFKCTGKAYFEAVTFIIHIKNLTHVKGGQVTLSYVHAIVIFLLEVMKICINIRIKNEWMTKFFIFIMSDKAIYVK